MTATERDATARPSQRRRRRDRILRRLPARGGPTTPTLAGAHHLELPVAHLDRSIRGDASRPGHQVAADLGRAGLRAGLSVVHPNGGPWPGPAPGPGGAAAATGFDRFSIGIPDAHEVRPCSTGSQAGTDPAMSKVMGGAP